MESPHSLSPSELIKYHVCQLLEVLRSQQDPEPPPTDEIVFKVKPRYLRLKLPDDAKEVLVLAVTEKGEYQLPAWEFPANTDDDEFTLSHKADQRYNRLHVMQTMADDTKCTMFAIEEVEPPKKKRHRKILRTTDIEEDGELTVNMIVDEVTDRDYKFCSLLRNEDDDDDIQMPPREVHMNLTVNASKAVTSLSTMQMSKPSPIVETIKPTIVMPTSKPSNVQGTKPSSYVQGTKSSSYVQGTKSLSYVQGTKPLSYVQGTKPSSYAQVSEPLTYLQPIKPRPSPVPSIVHLPQTSISNQVIIKPATTVSVSDASVVHTIPVSHATAPKLLMNERFTCMKCKVAFSSKSVLSCHFCPTEQKRSFICKTCNESFVHYKEFLRHIKNHSEYKPELAKQQPLRVETIKQTTFTSPHDIPSCSLCNALFPTEKERIAHLVSHHKSFRCEHCGQIFFKDADLADHKVSCKKPEPPVAKPSVVPKKPQEAEQLSNGSNFSCVLCGESFATIRKLQSHKLTHSSKQEVAYVSVEARKKNDENLCNVCCRAFVTPAALAAHSQVHNLTAYICSVCKMQFKTEELLDEHNMTKCSMKLICDRCGKCCSSVSTFKIHMATHSETRAFICNVCNAKFSSKEQLAGHKRIHGEKKFSCSVCARKFYSKQHYQRHMRCHSKQGGALRPLKTRSFRCTMCPDVFSSVSTLLQHYEKTHPLSSYKCTLCSASVSSFADVREHFRCLHRGLTILCCRICGDVFSDRILLRQHRAEHGLKRGRGKNETSRKLGPSKWCPICNTFFMTNRDFCDHLSLNKNCEQQLNEKLNAVCNVECEQCNKSFGLLQLLELHAVVHKSEPPFGCTVCNNTFEDSASFDVHISTHHPAFLESDEASAQADSGAKLKRSLYVCKVCRRSFPSLSSLTVHSYLHGGEKPFKCAECGLGFSHYSKLSHHQLMHKGDKLYRCSICWKAFWSKNALMMHLKNHSLQSSSTTLCSDAKQYPCTACDRSFSKQSHLTNHMRWHGGEKGILKKKFPCGECKHTFTTKAHLIIHEQMHKGTGLVCPECRKKFTTLAWLQYHMRVHTGESPECQVCGRGFTTRRAMEEHMSTHDESHGAFMCETCGAKFASNRYLKSHIKLFHTGDVPAVCRKCGLGFTGSDELIKHELACTSEMGNHLQVDTTGFAALPEEVVMTTATTTDGLSENVIVVTQPNVNYVSDNEIVTATSTLQAALQSPAGIQDGLQVSFANDFAQNLLQGSENAMMQEVYYSNQENLTLQPPVMSDIPQTIPLNTLVIDNNNIQLPPGLVLDGSQDVVVQIVSSKQLDELLSFNRVE